MNILLAEYSVHHDPALAPEGAAMLKVLRTSFFRSGYQVLMPDTGADFGEEIQRLAPLCQDGLVIAPDALLGRYTKILEDNTRNCGCNSFSIAVCANKRRCAAILSAHGIDVPAEVSSGKRVIKEIKGCGTIGMRFLDEEPGPGEFGLEYIDGEHLSVSLIGSRVVGESCLYYSGEKALFLAMNRQNISFEPDGTIRYGGGETPVTHPRQDIIIATARKALEVLGCQGYIGIDFVVSADRIVIVDVNPRPTTSIIGITACMEEEIGELILGASYGKILPAIHLNGHARFTADGKVEHDRD